MRLALALAVVVSVEASAAPLVAPHPGGPVFTGPTQGNVAAMIWNPAAAGLQRGTHIFIDGNLRLDGFSIARARIDSATGEPAAGGDLSFPEVNDTTMLFGGIAGISSDVGGNERFTIGGVFHIPFAETFPAGDPIAYHANGGNLVVPTAAVSTSIRATSNLYAGLTFHLHFPTIDLRFRRDDVLARCAAAPCPVESAAGVQDLRFVDDELNLAASFTLGSLLRAAGWWFGLAFTSAPFGFERADLPLSTRATLTAGDQRRTGRARITYHVPWILQVGARRPIFADWELIVGARLIGASGSTLVDIRPIGGMLTGAGVPEMIPRWQGHRETLSVEAGLERALGPLLRPGVRLRWEGSAVRPSRVSAAQLDAAKLGAAAGLELRPIDGFAVSASYAVAWYLPVSVDDSDYKPSSQIACNASGLDLDACTDAREGRAIPTAAGDYRRLAHSIHVGFSVDFW